MAAGLAADCHVYRPRQLEGGSHLGELILMDTLRGSPECRARPHEAMKLMIVSKGRRNCDFSTNPGPNSCLDGGCNGGLECDPHTGTVRHPRCASEATCVMLTSRLSCRASRPPPSQNSRSKAMGTRTSMMVRVVGPSYRSVFLTQRAPSFAR